MRITLPFPPYANRYWRVFRGRAVKSKDARDYQARVRWLAFAAKVKPLEGPLVVNIAAYRPRRVGDLDGMLKVALDAMNGIAWADDSQIVELHAARFDDAADPRLVLAVEPAAGNAPVVAKKGPPLRPGVPRGPRRRVAQGKLPFSEGDG